MSSQAEGRGAPPMSQAGTGSQVLFPQVLQSARELGAVGTWLGRREPRRNEAGRPSSTRVGGVEW